MRRQYSRDEWSRVLKLDQEDLGDGSLYGGNLGVGPFVPDRLTLVIGLGGSGMRAVVDAKRKTMDYFGHLPDGVRFLLVDSDEQDMHQVTEPGCDSFCFKNDAAMDALSMGHRDSFVRHILPEGYRGFHFIHGEHRLEKRVLLYSNNNGSWTDCALFQRICHYFNTVWEHYPGSPVDLVIVTGLCGNTGSGIFLDLAGIAKAACSHGGAVSVFGYFMLPDCFSKLAWNPGFQTPLYANAYAALKELESMEGMDLEAEARREVLATHFGELIFDEANPPYDYPILISDRDKEALSLISRHIVGNLEHTAAENHLRSVYDSAMLFRHLNLMENAVPQTDYRGDFFPDPCPEDSHRYFSLGYAEETFSEQLIIPHMISRIMGQFEWKKKLSRAEYEEAIRLLLPGKELTTHVLADQILECLLRCTQLKDNPVSITYDEAVNGQISAYLTGFQCPRAVQNGIRTMEQMMKDMLSRFRNSAFDIMKKFGPYVMQDLYQGNFWDADGQQKNVREISLKGQLEMVKIQLIRQIERPMPKPQPLEPLPMLTKALRGREYLENWKESIRRYQEWEVRKEVVRALLCSGGIWEGVLLTSIEKCFDTFQVFAQMFPCLEEYYTDRGKSLEKMDDFARVCRERKISSFCQEQRVFHWIRKKIDERLNNISVRVVRDSLVDELCSELEIRDLESWNPRAEFERIMGACCQFGRFGTGMAGMKLTIHDLVDEIFLHDGPNAQPMVSNLMYQSVGRLLTQSHISPDICRHDVLMRNTTRHFLVVPSNLMAALTNAGAGLLMHEVVHHFAVPIELVVDTQSNELRFYQVAGGLAVGNLENLPQWKEAYFRNFNVRETLNPNAYIHREYPELFELHMQNGYGQRKELTMKETCTAYCEANAADNNSTDYRNTVLVFSDRLDAGSQVPENLNLLYGTGLCWNHYPLADWTMNHLEMRPDGRADRDYVYRNKVFLPRVREAERLGIIEWEEHDDTHTCWINVIPGDWTNLDVSDYQEIDDFHYKRGKALFDFLKAKNPSSMELCRKQIAFRIPCFLGDAGFTFSHYVAWKKDRMPLMPHELRELYMLRILRKSVGLYEELLDTLWKYYSIECRLEEMDLEYQKDLSCRKFLSLYGQGFVMEDENSHRWSAIVSAHCDDSEIETEEIITFSKPYLLGLSSPERILYHAGLHLYCAYRAYQKWIDEDKTREDRIDAAYEPRMDTISDAYYDLIRKTTLGKMREELEIYHNLVGDTGRPLDTLRKHLLLIDEEDGSFLENLVKFYRECQREAEWVEGNVL